MVHDLPIGLHQGLCVERRLAVQHFIHAHAQGPPVALRSILALPILHGLQYFWGDVVGRPHRYGGLHLAEAPEQAVKKRTLRKLHADDELQAQDFNVSPQGY